MGSLYCSTALPTFTADPCANLQGRITAVAYIREDATITDYTDVDQWNTDITNGLIKVIKNVRGAKAKSTPNEIDGFGQESSRTVGRDYTLTYMHPDVAGNAAFYNTLNYDSGHRVAYWVNGGKAFVVENAVVNANADHVIEEGLNTIVTWDVELKWSSQANPIDYAAPASVFED